MSFRHFVYLAFAFLGAYAAVGYIRRAFIRGIRLSDFRFWGFMKNDANLQMNSGINLLIFGIIAALASIALLLKAFGKW